MQGSPTHDPTSGNRVFISCASDEFERTADAFQHLRTRLRGYLTAADCEVKVQEEFNQTPIDTLEKLDGYIRRCAAVIHLVGEKPGAIADPEAVATYLRAVPQFLEQRPALRGELGDLSGLTYTQWEAFLALHHGIPLFVYATAKAPNGQARHLERLRSVGRHPTVFEEPADLLGRLIGDLRAIVPTLGSTTQRLSPPRFLHHSAEHFLGREKELALLDTAWADGTNVLSFVAWGGVGKTALVSEWIQTRFIDRNWLDADGEPALLAYFDWSFYDQGTRASEEATTARTGSVGDFFEQALAFFGDEAVADRKGERLAKLVRQQRTLFVLDGLEPLQQPIGSLQAGRLIDPDLREFLATLAQSNPGLCLVTSRQALTDLGGVHGRGARTEDLDELPKAIAVRLLKMLQVHGTDRELEDACEKFGGHALSLTLLGRFLVDAHGGDVRRIDRIRDLQVADTLTREDRHRSVWKVLEAYEGWLAGATAHGNPKTLAVLRITGLFDRTATPDSLAALRNMRVSRLDQPSVSVEAGEVDAVFGPIVGLTDDEWNVLLRRLERAHLLSLQSDSSSSLAIDAHPLVREYFAKQLRERYPSAFKAGHSLLFDHLSRTTPNWPATLPELLPLYQAVTHGCLAGRHEEARADVYRDRILRGTGPLGNYSTFQLGAMGLDLGAVAAFFEEPWTRLSPNLAPLAQAWLLNEAAFRLRALGRLMEAVGPTRAALERMIQANEPHNAAISACNVCGLDLALGRLREAIDNGHRAIELADRSQSAGQRIINRSTTADALHQAGDRVKAAELFAEAEAIQAADQPSAPRLFSLQGFAFVDLLVGAAERAAWRSTLDEGAEQQKAASGSPPGNAMADCAAAEQRATEALELAIARSYSRLTVASDLLNLARIGLYRALLSSPSETDGAELVSAIDTALVRMRETNSLTHLPNALLTAAFHAGTLAHQPDDARRFLDEAQLIAERSPMPLYLADVHLHRARLFRDRDELARARALIDDLGYGRRREELADAEAAAARWPPPVPSAAS